MNKPQAFVVQPEWRKSYTGCWDLYFGDEVVGWADKSPNGPWVGYANEQRIPGQWEKRAEARAAVEAAVREALGGKPV